MAEAKQALNAGMVFAAFNCIGPSHIVMLISRLERSH